MSKAGLGAAVTLMDRRRRFENSLFVLAHMRCGSTALSNVICSRDDFSGYGEAHIAYRSTRDLGRLVVNQKLREAYSSQAPFLFDKILHTRHDGDTPEAFFQSRAIFLIRPALPTIRSIRHLFDTLGRDEYSTDAACAEYYCERLNALEKLWHQYPTNRRVAVTHPELIDDPDKTLARISKALEINPPLINSYKDISASRAGGAGDPLTSGTARRIEKRPERASKSSEEYKPDLSSADIENMEQIYRRLVSTFGLESSENDNRKP